MRLTHKPMTIAIAALACVVCIPAFAKRPKPLAEGTPAQTIVLNSDVRAYTLITQSGQNAYLALRACTYTRAFEDSTGDYYVAEPACIQSENIMSDGKTMNYQGGIWFPSKPGKEPRLYGVAGIDDETCKEIRLIPCIMSRMESGSFKMVSGKMNRDAVEILRAALTHSGKAI